MKPWKWIATGTVGVVLYLLFLIVSAPADFLADYAAPLTRNAVVLQQAHGSLWRGRAELVIPGAGPQALGQLGWRLYPLRLFGGTLAADMTFAGNDIDARATVNATRNRHALRDVTLSAPIKLISLLFPLTDALGLSGQLRLTASTLELDKHALRGNAEIIWSNATSRLLPLTQTGEYRLQIAAQGKHATLSLSTVKGPLQVIGQGEWRALEDGAFRLQGTVTPSTPQPALDPFLNAIGPAQANGARAFDIVTRLRPIDTVSLFP